VRPCEAGELNLTDRSVCLRCPAGQFGLDPTQPACSNCPAHATCPGGAALLPQTGYWLSSPRSMEVHKCLQPSACRCVEAQRLLCAATTLPQCRKPLSRTSVHILRVWLFSPILQQLATALHNGCHAATSYGSKSLVPPLQGHLHGSFAVFCGIKHMWPPHQRHPIPGAAVPGGLQRQPVQHMPG
jgi:hypothetical protein